MVHWRVLRAPKTYFFVTCLYAITIPPPPPLPPQVGFGWVAKVGVFWYARLFGLKVIYVLRRASSPLSCSSVQLFQGNFTIETGMIET